MIITGPQTEAYASGWDRIWGKKDDVITKEDIRRGIAILREAKPPAWDQGACKMCGAKLIWCETCEDYTVCPTHRHSWEHPNFRPPYVLADGTAVRPGVEPVPAAEGGLPASTGRLRSKSDNLRRLYTESVRGRGELL